MQWIICLSIGTLSGIISGLFGAAGGWFLVPALILGLPFTGVHGPELIKIAIATALTINVFTSFSTARAYAERGCVHWRALYFMLPGTAVGVIAGAMLAARADVTVVTVIFVAGALYMAWKMTRNPANGQAHHLDALPGFFNLSAKGVAVGGLVGAVGGGGLSVPIFLHYMTIHQAIGTASVLTIPISAMAVSTFAIAHAPQGCEGACVGYVHLPAVCATGIAAVLFAPAGSALAHSLPVQTLKRVFAVTLALAALNLGRKSLPSAPMLVREASAAAGVIRPGFHLCQNRAPRAVVRDMASH